MQVHSVALHDVFAAQSTSTSAACTSIKYTSADMRDAYSIKEKHETGGVEHNLLSKAEFVYFVEVHTAAVPGQYV
ncbi:hypothetical protein Pelo_895 [Pelomyxa schiedti]|nr:hypothetical protein Pelo_895 [Pelomyxa schiedti]